MKDLLTGKYLPIVVGCCSCGQAVMQKLIDNCGTYGRPQCANCGEEFILTEASEWAIAQEKEARNKTATLIHAVGRMRRQRRRGILHPFGGF